MNSNGFEKFNGLIGELEAVEARPSAPDPSPQFKNELRGQLLQQHQGRGFSRLEMGRLWGFAGTAVALLVLLGTAVYFWAVISNPSTAVSPNQDAVTVPARTAVPEEQPIVLPQATAVPETEILIAREDNLSIQFGNEIQLTGYELREDNRLETTTYSWWNGNEDTQETNRVYLSLTLYWQVQKQPRNDYTFFIHLLDEEGNIAHAYNVHTADRPQPITTWQEGQRVQEVHHLPLGTEFTSGHYKVIVSLYNSQTDVRLPVTAENEQMVVDEGTAVWLTDWEFNIEPTNRVWLISAIQKARPSATSTVEFEVTLGYEIASDEEVFLKLHYAAPDWETFAGDGRLPIDGMGDWVALNPDENSLTLTFSGSPGEMAQIVGTEQPVLVAQMGYFVGEGDGRKLDLLAVETFADHPFDLTSADEFSYTPGVGDSLEILNVSPPPGTTISNTTRFEVQLAYNLST